MTGRLAHLFLQENVKPAHLGIDFHTGSNYQTNLPQIRAQLDSPKTERMARVFGAPVILDAALREGSLRQTAAAMGACSSSTRGAKPCALTSGRYVSVLPGFSA
jgi:predicted deacylase